MKRLYLIRHAKSSWSEPGMRDFDRPLNQRGLEAAPFMGEKLKEKGVVPDLILSSPANRAITTAHMVARQVDYRNPIVENQGIYHASSNTLLEVVNALPDDKETVFLFGHNPGIGMFAEYLTGEYLGNMPTAGVVGVAFGFDRWANVSKQTGMLLFFDYPKQYGETD